MKFKIIIFLIILCSIPTSTAYVVPEKFRPDGLILTEFDIVRIALDLHDSGFDDSWVLKVLADASEENTNSGGIHNNYYQLRQWMDKIDRLQLPEFQGNFLEN